MADRNIKVVILGDGGTGKSCITMRLIRSKWVDEYDPTIEDSYSTQRTVDGVEYRLDIIDTAGQEEYRDMLGTLFASESSIDGYLLVYDITSAASLENLEYFAEMIEKNLQLAPHGPAPAKIVVGNKCDLSKNRVVSSVEGLQWAKAHGCGFMETSAKAKVNIEETFEIIIRQVIANRQKHAESSAQSQAITTQPSRGNLRAAFSSHNLRSSGQKEKKPKRGCCVIS